MDICALPFVLPQQVRTRCPHCKTFVEQGSICLITVDAEKNIHGVISDPSLSCCGNALIAPRYFKSMEEAFLYADLTRLSVPGTPVRILDRKYLEKVCRYFGYSITDILYGIRVRQKTENN